MDEPAKAAKFYSPPATVLITLGMFFAAQVVAGILIGVLPVLLGWDEARISSWLSDSAWAQFLFVLMVEAVTLWLLWWFMKRRDLKFTDIGLNKPRAMHVLYALGGFLVYLVGYVTILVVSTALVPSLDVDQKQELGFDTAATGGALLPIFISLVVLPPLIEEIVTRGFLFTGLRDKLKFVPAAIVTSLLFAAAHLGASSEGLLWVAGIDTFVLSLMLCFLREKTGSLWPSIGVHFIKNGVAFFVLFNIAQYFR